MNLKNLFELLGVLLIAYLAYSAIILAIHIKISAGISRSTKPFERIRPNAQTKILVLGDSTAVGVGAQDNNMSTAGMLGQKYPLASLSNISRTGKRAAEVLRDLSAIQNQKFNLILIQIGANDITNFTNLQMLKSEIGQVLNITSKMSDNVILLTAGNVGLAPIFPWPARLIYSSRTRGVRAIFSAEAAKHGAHYVDLYQNAKDDLFSKDPSKYYAKDMFHPSSEGYKYWFSKIQLYLPDNL